MRTFRLVLVLLAFTIPVLAQAGIRVAPVAGTAASPAIASQTARAHVAGVVTAAAVVPSETDLPSNSLPNSLASTAVPTAPVGPVPRIALVIGNSAYDARIGSLATPSSDAQLIAAGLRAVGFDVEVVVDANQGMMKQAISQFGQRLTASGRGSTGLFYYAGHAMQSDGVNYLIPVGAAITKEADIDLKAVTADSVLSQMKAAGASLTIVILDASRNIAIASAFRGGTTGLAQINAPTNSFLGFSTAPGALAADGSGTNSSFALALNAELQLAGQPIEILFRKVRRTVLQASGGKQTPWVASSLIDSFVFKQE